MSSRGAPLKNDGPELLDPVPATALEPPQGMLSLFGE